ncbi:MAG: sigma-54 dependent transcriptional regulator [Bacteriovoracaceae bacterium]|nr:sigma-54 dependent transcriptional regulator [Bacteroidota bacterium]
MTTKQYPVHPILLVDDEEHFLLSVELTLRSHGFNNINSCSDSSRVMKLLTQQKYSLIALDINMPNISGLELLVLIAAHHPDIPIIMLTAVNDIESAVLCMKEGAFDFIVKPVSNAKLVTTVKHGIELAEIKNENELLKRSLFRDAVEYPEYFSDIVTRSNSLLSIFKYIEAVAITNLPILITGETGTGKELFARAIHNASGRKGELVSVNVAGLDDTLFSDTLFGHKKGAYTGADTERKGLIEKAENGTLFLDEIGDLGIETQIKLLRLLQDGQYYPLGSDTSKRFNARIIVATHRNIKAMQEQNTFRQDLYYRLKSHHVHIPPLRERKSDVPLLTDHFILKASAQLNKKQPRPPKELYTLLNNYSFPGNVRELEGLIFDAVSQHNAGILSLEPIRKSISQVEKNFLSTATTNSSFPPISFPGRFPTLKEADDAMIEEALQRSEGNQAIAAELLGITRRALNNRLQRMNKNNRWV